MTALEKKIEDLVRHIIEGLGYNVYDVIYQKQGKENHLIIFIDNEKGISLNDCELVNNSITDILDEKNYIKEQYYLEISSSGIERTLRKEEHYIANINKKVQVNLYKPIEGKKEVIGKLKEYNEKYLIIDEIKIDRENISLAKTIYDWEEK